MNNRSKTARISRAYLLTRLSRHAFHPRGWNNRSSNPPSPSPNRYSINVIGRYNPRWSTRSAVNRGGFFARGIGFVIPFLEEERENHDDRTVFVSSLRYGFLPYVWNEVIKILRGPLIFLRIMVSIIPRRVVGSWSPPLPQPVFLARPIRRKNRSGVLLEIIRVRSASSSSSSPQFLTLVFFWWKFEREEGVDSSKFGRGILFSKGYLCGMGI